jgi:hypothetical protein
MFIYSAVQKMYFIRCAFITGTTWIITLVLSMCAEATTTNPWPESASELYRPSDRRMSAMLAPNFADRECHVFSVTDPYSRILGFLDRNRYFSIK